jgi:hypothetical protein
MFKSILALISSATSVAPILSACHVRATATGNPAHMAALGAVMAVAAATSSPAFATPPNTTSTASVSYEVGQGWVTHYFDEVIQNRWFRFGETRGRSYCIEAVQGSVSPIQLDPNISVYTDTSAATLLTVANVPQTNNDGGGDPIFLKGSRTCYVSPLAWNQPSTVRLIKLNVPITSGDSGNIRLRIVETTMYADLLGTNYGTSCGVTVTNTSPNVVKANGQPVAAGGEASLGCGGSLAMVAHDGPPGSLRGTAIISLYTQVANTGCYDPDGQGCGYSNVLSYMQAIPLRPRW